MRQGIQLLASLLLAVALASAQQVQPPPQGSQPPPPAGRGDQNNRALQLIADVYITQFKSSVGLSDDQFLKVGTFIRQFIQNRFRVANQRAALNQRRAQLLERGEPTQEDVQQFSNDFALFERNSGNMENTFLMRLRPEVTPRQLLLAQEFNRTFFEERLPQLLERARAETAARGQAQRPVRPNANRGKAPAPAPAAESLPNH